MRVLVLGGTKFIGAAAVRALLAGGHEVTCYHRGRTPGALPAEVRHVLGDRRELATRAAELAPLRPEALLDMVCMTEADACDTRALARALGCPRLVVASSCDVYRAFGLVLGSEEGPLAPLPLREDSPLRARLYPYRRDPPRAADDPDRWQDEYEKQRVEATLLAAADLAVTLIRLPMVHGPADPRRRVGEWLRRMRPGRRGLVIAASQAAWRPCRGFVDDAGRALALALTRPAAALGDGRVYHLADRPCAEGEWVAAIARAAGWDGRVLIVPDRDLPAPLQVEARLEQHLDLDTTRIEADLGWRPLGTPAEALARAVAWERATPWPDPTPDQRQAESAREAAEDELLARAG